MPILNIVVVLSVSVGLPFFVLSTTGPLLQRWFSLQHPGRSPYRLYSLSNAGSLAALLSYPFIVEPALKLRTQAWTWSALFLIFAGACTLLAVKASRTKADHDEILGRQPDNGENTSEKPCLYEKMIWVLLAAGASTMLLAVTNQMCQEVAVIPFLWILPLSIYLLTFIICFGHEKWYPSWFVIVFILAAFMMAFALVPNMGISLTWQILIFSFGLFVFCLTCHGELVKLKPHPKHLTSFYLCISIGGAVGGVFVALIAPWAFSGFWELHAGIIVCFCTAIYVIVRDKSSWMRRSGVLPEILLLSLSLALLAAALLYSGKKSISGMWNYTVGPAGMLIALLSCVLKRRGHTFFQKTRPLVYFATAGAITLLSVEIFLGYTNGNVSSMYRSRNFFGVLRVNRKVSSDDTWNRLVHGTIIHGMQSTILEKREQPLTYYHPESGVGRLLRYHPKKMSEMNSGLRIGCIGLGIGTIAAYADSGDYLRFYEINPTVSSLARGEGGFFSYLEDSRADIDIVLGDGRLSMERELDETGPMKFDALVLDAFSSDAIPVHLLTCEAFEMYLRHMSEDGVIAVHVSNRHIRLDPVVWKIADHLGLECVLIKTEGKRSLGWFSSSWMLLTKNREILDVNEITKDAESSSGDLQKYSLWTDDYSNLFEYLK